MGHTYLRGGGIWWISYPIPKRKPKRESSKSQNHADAVRLLKQRIGEIAQGKIPGAKEVSSATTLEDLTHLLLDEYRANNRRSTKRVAIAMRCICKFFGAETHAAKLTSADITAYKTWRAQQQGHKQQTIANATINHELANLQRAYALALDAGKVTAAPKIKKLAENNARSGFFEPEQYRAVLKELPEHLKIPIQLAYATGWRMQSELLTRQWRHVDLEKGWLRLDPGETKNKEARNFPLSPSLIALLQQQRAWVHGIEMRTHKIIPWIFCRPNGQPILTSGHRYAWQQACKRAGVAGRLIHDMRRTAVRNLERAGVSRSVAMKFTGHATEMVFRRYAITSESDLREGALKLAALHALDAARG